MLTNPSIRKTMDLFSIPPLDDIEVDERMRHFERLMQELEWKEVRALAVEMEISINQIQLDTKETIAAIESMYLEREAALRKETKIVIRRLNGDASLRLLDAQDRQVTDILLAVHHRLGRIDHHQHKKAYKRVLFALLVQALCRMADVGVGKSIFERTRSKFKELTGMDVTLQADSMNYLPLESCGGLNVSSVSRNKTVINSLACRLDSLLYKINPVIRILLYGPNEGRKFYDLSAMCGSRSLFWPPPPPSRGVSAFNENEDVDDDER